MRMVKKEEAREERDRGEIELMPLLGMKTESALAWDFIVFDVNRLS